MTAPPSLANPPTAEHARLALAARRDADWQRWGPYLAERQWATVREDYSENGDPWSYFPHDHARSRAYRWGEDGLLGICDRQCRLCFGLALWNTKDPILKERLFGLTGHQGNHGEDVKEYYYYLDSTPTHSYLKALYKYPQSAFPYERLIEENAQRSRHDPEFELADTGVFEGDRYFDVQAEYAKESPNDILIRLTITNRGPTAAPLTVLPTIWFRNTWSWGCTHEGCELRPRLVRAGEESIAAEHTTLGNFVLHAEPHLDSPPPEILFTDNETNQVRLFGAEPPTGYVKDAFHEYVIAGKRDAVRTQPFGTKGAFVYSLRIPAGQSVVLRLRLQSESDAGSSPFDESFDEVFQERIAEADDFYAQVIPAEQSAEKRLISRQAYAGLLWTKQFYHYAIREWLDGDPDQPPPPASRREGRNRDWGHLFNRDVVSMPDKWEYPWYAAWDLAFHMVPFASIDPEFAKSQLLLLLREWYMHPSGQMPAYEFNFSDVNPPVHAWACWRVYKLTAPRGQRDRTFLARAFHKLLLNFTWWVNRKDLEGKHLFAGGFLGLDNIGVFDRSQPLPSGQRIEQADGTGWMAFFCGTMLSMALELADGDPAYEDVASKFFEHFVAIVDAMNSLGGSGLWDEADGFYYDRLHCDRLSQHLRVRSLVGLLPLIAVEVLDEERIQRLPGFRKRMMWFLENRPEMAQFVSYMETHCPHGSSRTHRLLAIPSRERLRKVLHYLLDEDEFLSPYGIRSLSKVHERQPFAFHFDGEERRVDYTPGESTTPMFGGNSNWRGPIWLPVNFLIVEALERYFHYYGPDYVVECPTGSGRVRNLQEVAEEIAARVNRLFLPDAAGARACHGGDSRYAVDPHWRDLLLFHEYFHAETGAGLGASHQTGWTALIVKFLEGCRR